MVRYWPFWALTGFMRAQHGQTSFSFFRTAFRQFAVPILCMWLDSITIRPHAKYRPKRSSFWRRFGHLVRPQLFLNGFSPIRDADTLHVVGSGHGSTSCKVSTKTIDWMPKFWAFGALTGACCERPKWPNVVCIHFSERLLDGSNRRNVACGWFMT
jgi:hypothetical protein